MPRRQSPDSYKTHALRACQRYSVGAEAATRAPDPHGGAPVSAATAERNQEMADRLGCFSAATKADEGANIRDIASR